jgi:DNA-binding XRE family transcriptional regulator
LEEENLVKKTCKELGITQKQLAEKIGIKPESLNSSISRGIITNQVFKSIEMLNQIYLLKEKLDSCYKKEEAFKEILSHQIKK